jgi:hypothetical protein
MRKLLAVLCLALASGLWTLPARSAEPVQRPALDAIFNAFSTHAVVGLGDAHGVAESGAFYTTLIRDPRFAAEVGNVVVEFGGASQQATIDRYVAGEDVAYEQLRRVWLDAGGWYPGVIETMYPAFFAQVRAVNLALPPERRIRVWLGEPPIDWDRVRTPEQSLAWSAGRNEHPAQLIEREILAKGRKALVIYGGGHFTRQPGSPFPNDRMINARIEETHPGAVYVVLPHLPVEPACRAEFEARTRGWTSGTVAAPVKGTWMEELYARPGCFRSGRERNAMADALLYLGDPGDYRMSPVDPRAYLDEAYFRELSRRNEVAVGEPLNWAEFVREYAK